MNSQYRHAQSSTIALFFALISISLVNVSKDPSNPQFKTLEKIETPRPNHIVRFVDYRLAQDHRIYLESNLGSAGWTWIERRNTAASFPTDFGLVVIKGSFPNEAFEKLERVKNVAIDFSYSRGLLVDEMKKGDGFGSEKDEVKKWPGKIFTLMSFEDGWVYAEIGNSTISWRRNLLMQRSQVTSIFGAEKLWAKGFTGAKVKMAIFDTRIRVEHSHFHNIKLDMLMLVVSQWFLPVFVAITAYMENETEAASSEERVRNRSSCQLSVECRLENSTNSS